MLSVTRKWANVRRGYYQSRIATSAEINTVSIMKAGVRRWIHNDNCIDSIIIASLRKLPLPANHNSNYNHYRLQQPQYQQHLKQRQTERKIYTASKFSAPSHFAKTKTKEKKKGTDSTMPLRGFLFNQLRINFEDIEKTPPYFPRSSIVESPQTSEVLELPEQIQKVKPIVTERQLHEAYGAKNYHNIKSETVTFALIQSFLLMAQNRQRLNLLLSLKGGVARETESQEENLDDSSNSNNNNNNHSYDNKDSKTANEIDEHNAETIAKEFNEIPIEQRYKLVASLYDSTNEEYRQGRGRIELMKDLNKIDLVEMVHNLKSEALIELLEATDYYFVGGEGTNDADVDKEVEVLFDFAERMNLQITTCTSPVDLMGKLTKIFEEFAKKYETLTAQQKQEHSTVENFVRVGNLQSDLLIKLSSALCEAHEFVNHQVLSLLAHNFNVLKFYNCTTMIQNVVFDLNFKGSELLFVEMLNLAEAKQDRHLYAKLVTLLAGFHELEDMSGLEALLDPGRLSANYVFTNRTDIAYTVEMPIDHELRSEIFRPVLGKTLRALKIYALQCTSQFYKNNSGNKNNRRQNMSSKDGQNKDRIYFGNLVDQFFHRKNHAKFAWVLHENLDTLKINNVSNSSPAGGSCTQGNNRLVMAQIKPVKGTLAKFDTVNIKTISQAIEGCNRLGLYDLADLLLFKVVSDSYFINKSYGDGDGDGSGMSELRVHICNDVLLPKEYLAINNLTFGDNTKPQANNPENTNKDGKVGAGAESGFSKDLQLLFPILTIDSYLDKIFATENHQQLIWMFKILKITYLKPLMMSISESVHSMYYKNWNQFEAKYNNFFSIEDIIKHEILQHITNVTNSVGQTNNNQDSNASNRNGQKYIDKFYNCGSQFSETLKRNNNDNRINKNFINKFYAMCFKFEKYEFIQEMEHAYLIDFDKIIYPKARQSTKKLIDQRIKERRFKEANLEWRISGGAG